MNKDTFDGLQHGDYLKAALAQLKVTNSDELEAIAKWWREGGKDSYIMLKATTRDDRELVIAGINGVIEAKLKQLRG